MGSCNSNCSPVHIRANYILQQHGVGSERAEVKRGPRLHEEIEAIIADVRKANLAAALRENGLRAVRR